MALWVIVEQSVPMLYLVLLTGSLVQGSRLSSLFTCLLLAGDEHQAEADQHRREVREGAEGRQGQQDQQSQVREEENNLDVYNSRLLGEVESF